MEVLTLSISSCTNMCLGMTCQLKITILHSLNRSDLSNETTPKCKQRFFIIVVSQWPLFVQWWHTHTGHINSSWDNQGITFNLLYDWKLSTCIYIILTYNYNEDPGKKLIFLDKSKRKISRHLRLHSRNPLKCSNNDFLSVHCFPKKFFYRPQRSYQYLHRFWKCEKVSI